MSELIDGIDWRRSDRCHTSSCSVETAVALGGTLIRNSEVPEVVGVIPAGQEDAFSALASKRPVSVGM